LYVGIITRFFDTVTAFRLRSENTLFEKKYLVF